MTQDATVPAFKSFSVYQSKTLKLTHDAITRRPCVTQIRTGFLLSPVAVKVSSAGLLREFATSLQACSLGRYAFMDKFIITAIYVKLMRSCFVKMHIVESAT